MRRSFFIILVLCLGIAIQPLNAQQHPNRRGDNKLKYVIGTEVNISDSINAYKLLYENIPQDKDFLNDPIFAIVGRRGYFYFSVGANLKLGLCYDWGNPVDNPQGVSVAGMQKAAPGDAQEFQMTAQSSNIYFNIIGFPNSTNRAGLFFSLSLSTASLEILTRSTPTTSICAGETSPPDIPQACIMTWPPTPIPSTDTAPSLPEDTTTS